MYCQKLFWTGDSMFLPLFEGRLAPSRRSPYSGYHFLHSILGCLHDARLQITNPPQHVSTRQLSPSITLLETTRYHQRGDLFFSEVVVSHV